MQEKKSAMTKPCPWMSYRIDFGLRPPLANALQRLFLMQKDAGAKLGDPGSQFV
jgi:hypothetical protein